MAHGDAATLIIRLNHLFMHFSSATLGLIALVISTGTAPACFAQQPNLSTASPQMPSINLGLTSFLDGMAGPGWMAEEYGQAVHDSQTINASGERSASAPTINSGSGISHIAYISPRKLAGAWVGAEVLVPVAYVDAGSAGSRGGIGDITLGPMLQWPEQKLFGMSFHQRVLADFEIPTGTYTAAQGAVNIGNHAWTVHPYYAFTLLPGRHLETSWRISYLWNSRDASPAAQSGVDSTQAGQALHFNATLAYRVGNHFVFGANGYFFHQLTDSQVNSLPQPGTEILGAIGPGAMIHRGSWFYYVNAYREFSAVDTSEGNKLVLRIEKVF